MKFKLSELTKMLHEIGCNIYDMQKIFKVQDALLGIKLYGHPIIDMNALEDYIGLTDGESMRDWLAKHSSYSIETWKYYLGVCENDKQGSAQ